MNAKADFDIGQILGTLNRRKSIIVAVFFVISMLTICLSLTLPDVYQSNALILVTPQRVPSAFVTSTVTIDLGERMHAIIQEILSRTQLEKIVTELNLYPSEETRDTLLEHRVERLRKNMKVELRRNNVFQLSYESESPEKAQKVVSRLASFFIEQNLQVREQQALGTTSFINAEAERLRHDLEEQEKVINQYRGAHRYELPDQLDTNLRSLDQFRRELDTGRQRIAGLQDRKAILQKQAVESDLLGMDLLGGALLAGNSGGYPENQNVQVQMKRKELGALLQRYSLRHPDVVRVKKEIELLEATKEAAAPRIAVAKEPAVNPLKQILQTQISDIDAELQAIRLQNERIGRQVTILQSRVDNASTHGIELSKITRGYDITLRKYQDLLAKTMESELSENMEKKQKGEQFQVADPPNFPLSPVRPHRSKILLVGAVLGFAAGTGLAFLWDNFDTSFKRGEDLSSYLNVPLLATIPASVTRGSVMDQRRSQGVLIFASIGILAVGVLCVRMFGPMYF
jgi:polysaccharide chain length determinant protein (PEP-CTERM system associated)